jgi:hypothetical protein
VPKDVRILAARRSWEFRPDDIRLTFLTLPELQSLIRGHFEFQTVIVGTPLPTFGPAVQSVPPGLVFDNGGVAIDKRHVPIRFLHFEVSRIVVDVAGPSEAAEAVYSQLIDLLKDRRSPDGAPVLGKPYRSIEMSQISARVSFPVDALFAPAFVDASLAFAQNSEKGLRLAPNIYWRASDAESEFQGIVDGDPTAFQIAPRAGYPVGSGQCFSAAPLPTSRHIEYLSRLEQVIKPRPERGASSAPGDVKHRVAGGPEAAAERVRAVEPKRRPGP